MAPPVGDGIRLLVMSDTHLPLRARDLPARLWDEVDRADLVVHAGDWVDVATLDRLEARSSALLACWGNNDGPELRARLPEVARATVEGVRVAVVHETGAKERRGERMRAAYPDTDLLVFGHSHIPWDTHACRTATAEPRLPHRPASGAVLHLPDRAPRRRRRCSTSSSTGCRRGSPERPATAGAVRPGRRRSAGSS